MSGCGPSSSRISGNRTLAATDEATRRFLGKRVGALLAGRLEEPREALVAYRQVLAGGYDGDAERSGENALAKRTRTCVSRPQRCSRRCCEPSRSGGISPTCSSCAFGRKPIPAIAPRPFARSPRPPRLAARSRTERSIRFYGRSSKSRTTRNSTRTPSASPNESVKPGGSATRTPSPIARSASSMRRR